MELNIDGTDQRLVKALIEHLLKDLAARPSSVIVRIHGDGVVKELTPAGAKRHLEHYLDLTEQHLRRAAGFSPVSKEMVIERDEAGEIVATHEKYRY